MKTNNANEAAKSPVTDFLCYGRELQNFLLRRINRAEDAEDVVQEVFLRLLRIRNPEFLRNPRAYIYGMAFHVVREFKMRDVKAGTWATFDPQIIMELAERPDEIRQNDMPDQLDIQQKLASVLLRLPEAHRAAFVLHNRDGYSYEEIAEQMKVSVHTVSKYLLQAKVKIRTMEWD